MRSFPVILIVLALTSCVQPTPSSRLLSENSDVALKELVSKSLQAHAADTFKVNLLENSFVTGVTNQLSVDAVVNVYGPDKKSNLGSFDGPSRGPETFQFITKEAGVHYIVVTPFEDNKGNYTFQLNTAELLATDPVQRVDQIVAATIGEHSPGASIEVMKDGKVVYSKGFGYADLEYNIKNTPQTIFHIASVSKQFTGFAIAMLADQGKVSMEDDVRKYIPELHDFGTPITLNQLVHHTSGLRDQWNLLAMAGWRLDDVITREQVMRIVTKQRKLNFKPGDEFVYCNTGFTLLAEVVSRVSGKSFAEWTKENIFAPLEMNNTLFYDDHEKIVPNRAYSYHRSDTIFKKSVLSYANVGATSLFTTVEDLNKWAMNFETVKVGNKHVMDMMEQRYILNKGDTIDYAFGQSIGKHKGLKTVSHGGADAGYRTMLLRFPEQHFVVSVFSNLASFNPGGLSYEIANVFLADQLKEEPKKKEEPAPEKKPEFDASGVKLTDYTGRFYSDELETFYEFEVKNDTLVAHHQRHDDFKLKPTGLDTFEAGAWWMGTLKFARDNTKKVTGVSSSNGRVRDLEFKKQL